MRGPTVFDGYENDEAATRAAFVNGWYRTGDLGYLDADNYLYITGRIKELINRGGQKISPNEIDDALLAHPGVSAACAYPVPHPILGEEIAAAVVPKAGTSVTERALADFLRERLAQYKIPTRFTLVDEIPKGPTGKIQRHKLASEFDGTAEAKPSAGGDEDRPATPLERRLQEIWASVLGRSRVGLHDEFFALGGDSLQAVELFLQIEKTLGRQLPRSVLFEASTVADMAKQMETGAPVRCLVPIQPDGDLPIFFAVHDINGQVLIFRALAHLLGKDQRFYGIQLAGLDGAEAPLARIEDMAARYIEEVRSLQPTGPYYLGGYSMGGVIAYEMAQQLRRAGMNVGILALFDTFPRHGRQRPVLPEWFAQNGNRLSGVGPLPVACYLGRGLANIARNTRTAIRRRLFGMAWRLCEIRRAPMPKCLWRPLAANHLAIRSYRMRPYDGDAALFTAAPFRDDHRYMQESWRGLIGGRLEVLPISGTHDEILEEPHVRDLARKLSASLRERQKGANCETHRVAATGKG